MAGFQLNSETKHGGDYSRAAFGDFVYNASAEGGAQFSPWVFAGLGALVLLGVVWMVRR